MALHYSYKKQKENAYKFFMIIVGYSKMFSEGVTLHLSFCFPHALSELVLS